MHGFRWVVLCVGALGLLLLLIQHWVHALGILPYLVLLACPLLHLFHRHHAGPRLRGGEENGKETII